MRFELLRDSGDWAMYQQCTIATFKMVGTVLFGKGPTEYPCLVISMPLDASRIACCYVYPTDAAKLLQATGKFMSVPLDQIPTAEPMRGPRASAPELPAVMEHFRAASAHFLTIVELLVDTGITKKDQYEERWNRWLAFVDQEQMTQRAVTASAVTSQLKDK